MIKKLSVKNFRSLRDVTIDLRRRNVLVGPNMSGKSNLIDVLRFLNRIVFAQPGQTGLPTAVRSFGGFSELAWKGEDPGVLQIAVEGDDPVIGPMGGWNYTLRLVSDRNEFVRISNETLTIQTTSGTRELIKEGPNGTRILCNQDDRTFSQIGSQDRSALEFEIPDWEGNRLREFISSWRFYNLIPPMMKTSNQTAAVPYLTEHGENLSSWLLTIQTRYSESFAQITRVMKDLFPEIESLFASPSQQATVLVASKERFLRRPVSADFMSDGELVFLALVSLLFCPRELGSDLYCIEEPENHLHPRLLDVLVELQRQIPIEDSAQTFTTTHSPYYVDKCDLDDIIVVERRNGATSCIRPSDRPHLRQLLQSHEIGLGDLFYSGALSSAT